MKKRNWISEKFIDPDSALGYKLMIIMILAVILVAILTTILMGWIWV